MIRVLKYLVVILLSSLAVKGQIYIKPNNTYGIIQNRSRDDSTKLIPTFPVPPSGKAALHSTDQKMSALYFDSTGKKFYVYSPSDSSWTKLGATQLNDSMFIVGRDTIKIRGTGGGGGGSADSTVFSTNYRRDTAIANVRTQIAGKQPTGNYITALTGPVTAAGPGSAATSITNNAITNAMLAQMAAHTFKGNNTGSTANAIDLTATQLTAELNVFGASLKGLVPAASGSPSSAKYLSEDGSFTTPAGGGSTLTAGIQTGITNSKINYDPRVNSNLIFNDFLLTSIGPKWDASNASHTTITFSAGHMRLVGGNSADYIFDSATTIIHRWTEEIGAVIQSIGGSDYFSFGIQAQGIQTILIKIKNSDLSSTITYNNGATTLGTTTAQGSTVAGDSVIFRIRRDNYILYFDIINVTQSSSKTFSYVYTNVDAVSGTVIPFRAFSITLNPIAGTIDIDYVKLINQERLYADWALIGMSITEGFNAGAPDSTVYNRLQNYFPDKRFVLYALSGSKAEDFITGGSLENDMLALRAKRALLMFGINEIQASESVQAFIAHMRALNDSLENHGTQVMICNTTPYNSANKAAIIAYNSALVAEFGKQVINWYDTLEVNGLMKSSNDSLHPDAPGHRFGFDVLKDEMTRLANTPYDPEGIPRIFLRGIEAGTSTYGIQSNFGIIPLNIGTSGTNYPSIGYNIKYSSTSGVHAYKASDISTKIEMGSNSGANIGFYTAPSGTAGDPITFTQQMAITPTGIGIGSTNAISYLHIKKNGNSLTTLGNARWITCDNTGGALGDRLEIGLSYLNGNTYSATVIGTKIVKNIGFTANDFYIANRDDESGDNQPPVRFLIHPNGYTGIKVLDPQQALHVGGQVQIDTVTTGSGTDSILVINNGLVKKILSTSGSGITSINSQTGSSQTIAGDQGNTVTQASNVITIHSPYSLYFSDTSATTVTNTTTESTVIGNVIGSTSFDGGTLTAGSLIKLKGYGYVNTDAVTPGNLQFNFIVSNFTLGVTFSTLLPAGLANADYDYEFEISSFTLGTNKDMFYVGKVDIVNNTTGVVTTERFSGKGTMTTTGTLSTDVTVKWSIADTDNSVISRNNILEVKRLQ